MVRLGAGLHYMTCSHKGMIMSELSGNGTAPTAGCKDRGCPVPVTDPGITAREPGATLKNLPWITTHTEDGYLVTAADDTILYANHRAQSFLGLSAEGPAVPERFREMALRRYRCEPEDAWAGWPHKQTETMRYLIRPQTSGSPSVWLQVELTGSLPGIPLGRLVRLHDVSDVVAARRGTWIFQSMISHKLKTPLATLMSCLEMMDLDQDLLPPDMRELVDLSCLNIKRLHRDITEIVQLSDRQAPRLGDHFRMSNLPDLVDHLGTELRLRRISVLGFRPAATLYLALCPETIETVLIELLENAREFHPDHDPQVMITVTLHDDSRLALRVIDDGISLSSARQQRAIIPSIHGEDYVTGDMPGSGRGLSVIATLVWENGGSCRLGNRDDGTGVVAEVVLPYIRR